MFNNSYHSKGVSAEQQSKDCVVLWVDVGHSSWEQIDVVLTQTRDEKSTL